MNSPTLILFAKKPAPGKVKTRFYPHCSYETAASIALAMIEHTVIVASKGWKGPICLLASPDDCHAGLREIASNAGIKTGSQCSGDLGLKMESAIRDCLAASSPVGLMGCDIPGVQVQFLRRAHDHLAEGKNVLGPSADGGFYFIGLQSCPLGMLQNMEWGTSEVARNVIGRANFNNIRFEIILECLQDVDTWEDFEFMANRFPRFKQFLEQIPPDSDSAGQLQD